jgi:hypothetical protein
MDVLSTSTRGAAPEWLAAQMPPGYQTRFAEIQRLSAELHGMDRMGRLLWESGPALAEAVAETFAALKLDTQVLPDASGALAARLDTKRRLLLHVQGSSQVIEKRGAEPPRAFQLLHEFAGPDDRVVVLANPFGDRPPADRPQPIAADALALFSRMGVNVLTGATLFGIWTLSLPDQARARTLIERLYAQDGGLFQPNF